MRRRDLLSAGGALIAGLVPFHHGRQRAKRGAAVALGHADWSPWGEQVQACFDVRQYGARGDGISFDDGAIVAAVEAAKKAGGGTVFFSPGVYRVANAREVTLRDCANITLFGPGALLRNDTYTGADGGVITFRGSSKNVAILGMGFEAATHSPNAYDNSLGFACEPPDSVQNILIRGCRFLRASNKHINIECPANNITIEHCYFEESLFNSPPLATPTRHGAVLLAFRRGFEHEISDVTIQNNYFTNNWEFAISIDQFEFPGNRAYLHDIHIAGNVFRNSTAGVWARGANIWITGNTFDNVGLSWLSSRYALDRSSGRFLSLFRSSAGQRPAPDNTIQMQRAAVVETDDARGVWILDNMFVNCATAQLSGALQPSDAVYVASGGSQGLQMVGNRAYEDHSLAGPLPPFACSTVAGSVCSGNQVLVGQRPPAIGPAPVWPDTTVLPSGLCPAPAPGGR